MRNRLVYPLVLIGLLIASVAHAGPTFKEFTLVNQSNTDAYDLHVGMNQPISTIRSNHIFTNDNPPKDTGNMFGKAVSGKPSNFVVDYTMPTGGEIVKPGYSVKFGLETTAAQLVKPGFSVSSPKYFTDINGKEIPNSAKLVAANVDLNRDPNTAIVSATTGNPTSDFLFLTHIRIWTGLTQAQALSFDANGNYQTSGLPSSPNFKPSDITLSPNQSSGPSITLGNLSSDSYVVALYDLADGPDSLPSDATQYGEFVFAGQSVPEPATVTLGGMALLGFFGHRYLVCAKRRRENGSKT
jgi:hypothetical protein